MLRTKRILENSAGLPSGATVAGSKTGTFTNADLVGGILTITHNMGRPVGVLIKDSSGVYEGALAVDETDLNILEVDFGGAIGAGTWTWLVTG